jgi:hypothetical protein
MPIKRRLTPAEITARKNRQPGNRNAPSALTEYTFLTDDEQTAVRESLDANETTDEFLARFGSDTPEADRDTLVAEFDRARNARSAAAQRRDRGASRPGVSEPVRQRQPVSPSNPFGAYLDPRHDDLPEYPAVGNAQRKQLQEVSKDYRQAASALEAALDSMTDDFAEAFAQEDARAAVRERMKNTANPKILQDHQQRMNRIG